MSDCNHGHPNCRDLLWVVITTKISCLELSNFGIWAYKARAKNILVTLIFNFNFNHDVQKLKLESLHLSSSSDHKSSLRTLF